MMAIPTCQIQSEGIESPDSLSNQTKPLGNTIYFYKCRFDNQRQPMAKRDPLAVYKILVSTNLDRPLSQNLIVQLIMGVNSFGNCRLQPFWWKIKYDHQKNPRSIPSKSIA